jgi:hypothetical protein
LGGTLYEQCQLSAWMKNFVLQKMISMRALADYCCSVDCIWSLISLEKCKGTFFKEWVAHTSSNDHAAWFVLPPTYLAKVLLHYWTELYNQLYDLGAIILFTGDTSHLYQVNHRYDRYFVDVQFEQVLADTLPGTIVRTMSPYSFSFIFPKRRMKIDTNPVLCVVLSLTIEVVSYWLGKHWSTLSSRSSENTWEEYWISSDGKLGAKWSTQSWPPNDGSL